MKITPLDSWIASKIGNPGCLVKRDRLQAYQLQKLKGNLSLVKKRSPYYKKHLKDVDPEAITSFKEFGCVPFTSPEDVKSNALEFLCTHPNKINRIVTLPTSGTTGEPKRIYFTAEDQNLTIDFFYWGMSTMVGPGERVLILLPGERPGSVGDLLNTALEKLGAERIIHGPINDLSQALKVLLNNKIDCIVGIPVQVLALARYQKAKKPEFVPPKNVLLSTDHVPDALVSELQEMWDCRVFNHYGMTEMGLGGGVECEAFSGYHLREADLLFEIVHPITGKPVREGELGEVVFTTLTRQGMPFIRYRTGDLSRFIPESCPCKTELRRMERIKGRFEGIIRLSGDNFITMEELNEIMFKFKGLADFNVLIEQKRGIDYVRIDLKKGPWAAPFKLESICQAVNSLPAIQNAQRHGMKLVINEVDNWPENNGTAKRRIIDMRKKGGKI